MDIEEILAIITGSVFIALILFKLMFVIDRGVNIEECISLGYPEVRNTWDLRTYCLDPVNIHRDNKVHWLE